MSVLSWFKELFTQLVAWLGEAVARFVEDLLRVMENAWSSWILPALQKAYGAVSSYYVIFYRSAKKLYETCVEIWNPQALHTRPSRVFRLKQAPANTPLPSRREDARVMVLELGN